MSESDSKLIQTRFLKNSYLSKNGFVIKKANLMGSDVCDSEIFEELEYLKRTLWGRPISDSRFSMFDSGANTTFPLYTETKNKLYIPKIFGIKRYGFPKKRLDNYNGQKWNDSITFTGTLYDSQKQPIEILLNELNEGNGKTGGILSLATGGGKTVSGLYVLSKLKSKAIIIVNKISLLKQWENEISQFLPEAKIGILQGQKKIDIENKDIIIAMLQSLARIDYPPHFFDEIGVTLVDEVHNVSSRVFSKVLMKLASHYTIGLSATPQRSDGCEYVFQWFIGDIVYKSSNERKGLPPIVNTIKISSDEYKEIVIENKITRQNQIQFTSMISDLVKMEKRNRLIVEIIKNLVQNENRKILILSDRREHVKTIKKIFDTDKSISFTYGLFLGQMKIAELERSKASQVILATYQAFGEGVSEKELDTLILITPKKFIGHLKTTKNESGKLEQIIGRIFRKEHKDKNPLIIDLHDQFSIYKNHARQRIAFYKQHFKQIFFREQSINLDNYSLSELSVDCLEDKIKNQKQSHNKKPINIDSADFESEAESDIEIGAKLYQTCLL